mmetsp:Transcript_72672/g.183733  ORF Transcript_72672/g.183733 Transcript_72672/m.183733 type:complete len:265 (+) Transcript_72672:269-1063(+)
MLICSATAYSSNIDVTPRGCRQNKRVNPCVPFQAVQEQRALNVLLQDSSWLRQAVDCLHQVFTRLDQGDVLPLRTIAGLDNYRGRSIGKSLRADRFNALSAHATPSAQANPKGLNADFRYAPRPGPECGACGQQDLRQWNLGSHRTHARDVRQELTPAERPQALHNVVLAVDPDNSATAAACCRPAELMRRQLEHRMLKRLGACNIDARRSICSREVGLAHLTHVGQGLHRCCPNDNVLVPQYLCNLPCEIRGLLAQQTQDLQS